MVLLLCLTTVVLSVVILVGISRKNQLLHQLARTNAELERCVTKRTATLRESEALARHISDVAPAVLYIYDLRERRTVWANRELVATLGHAENEIVALGSKLLETLMHPDDLERYAEHEERVRKLADGETAQFEYRFRHANGSWVWLHSRHMIFKRDAEGLPIQFIGAALDIGAAKEADEKLREHERQLELVINAVPALLFYVDAQSRYVSMNHACEAWFGVRREDIIGHTVRELVGEKAWSHIAPNHVRALAGERVEFEDEVHYRQGRRWVRASYTPHIESHGNVVGIVVLVPDC